ncbi:hypothetical protein KIPB_017160, partial [Kipferlia bialata]
FSLSPSTPLFLTTSMSFLSPSVAGRSPGVPGSSLRQSDTARNFSMEDFQSMSTVFSHTNMT